MDVRKRLIEILNNAPNGYEKLGQRFYKHILENIADYLLENNVIALPVKVGQKVYDISEEFIAPCTVGTIFLGNYEDIDGNRSHMAKLYFGREDCPYDTEEIYFTDIGKTVFLTKEQAEKALQGGAE